MRSRCVLREVDEDDLPLFFEHQRQPAAVHMAAFTAKDPDCRDAFDAHWARIRDDDEVLIRTIVVDGTVVGSVLSYVLLESPEVSYWIAQDHWGQGIASEALALFLELQTERPIYARVATDNLGSIRVLEKNSFAIQSEGTGFANARGEETAEYVMILEGRDAHGAQPSPQSDFG